MAFSHAHKFDPAIYHFTLICKSLMHPARVIIIKRLIASHGEWVKGSDLGADLPLAKQTLSDHFKLLREMSIIKCEVRHPYTYYALNDSLLNTLVALFNLATQADLKYDENYIQEIDVVAARRRIGTTPY